MLSPQREQAPSGEYGIRRLYPRLIDLGELIKSLFWYTRKMDLGHVPGQKRGTLMTIIVFAMRPPQSTLISTLLPSGSRTKVDRPLPREPLLTSAWVGSKPLRLRVAITS